MRVELVLAWARDFLAEQKVNAQIRQDVSEGMERQQREYLLRQQLAAIRKELGEDDTDPDGEYRAKLDALTMPASVRAAVEKEIVRLERTSGQSPEQGWIRSWLDRVLALPWGTTTPDSIDIPGARAVLDADHYGLDDVKKRIVEFLAVRKLRAARQAATEGAEDETVTSTGGGHREAPDSPDSPTGESTPPTDAPTSRSRPGESPAIRPGNAARRAASISSTWRPTISASTAEARTGVGARPNRPIPQRTTVSPLSTSSARAVPAMAKSPWRRATSSTVCPHRPDQTGNEMAVSSSSSSIAWSHNPVKKSGRERSARRGFRAPRASHRA